MFVFSLLNNNYRKLITQCWLFGVVSWEDPLLGSNSPLPPATIILIQNFDAVSCVEGKVSIL